jgi:carboxyl-terminal processing protease
MRLRPLFALAVLSAATTAVAQEQAPPERAPQEQAPPEAPRPVAPSDDPGAVERAPSKVPLAEIQRYVTVFNAVREAYVDPVDERKLMQSAVRGLLLELDPHSAYLEKSAAEEFDEQTRGAYEGVGVELVQLPDRTLRVVAPIDDTPAARAGLKPGDVIVAIDGTPLAGDNDPARDVGANPLRGAPGSRIVLTIAREGVAKPFDVTLVRETIRITSVRSRLLEPGYGYVRIATFQADTASDFARALERLQAQGTLRGLAIDLRSNPGGLLTAAVQIADELLERGRIVSTRGRLAAGDAEFSATAGDRIKGAPVVVIVDAGSASASEVLAGALRDHKRARVVGSRTFGKGSVQTLLPLDNGDSVKLTTARYYTPSGKSIQALGIEPDVVLHPGASTSNGGRSYTEAALPGHLAVEGTDVPGANAGEVLEGEAPIEAALAELKKQVAVAPPAATGKRN